MKIAARRSCPGLGRVIPTLHIKPSLTRSVTFLICGPPCLLLQHVTGRRVHYANLAAIWLRPEVRSEHPEEVRDDERQRISVVRDSRLVPLLPSSSKPASREQPWKDLLLERHTVPAIEIPEHEHRDFCLHLQTEGSDPMEWWSEGKNRIERTAPGSMILLPPGTRDRLLWRGTSKRIILSFPDDLLKNLVEDAGGAVPSFQSQWSLQDPALRYLVTEMGREASEGWPLGKLYADLAATSLASLLLRRHALEKLFLPETRGGLPGPQLRQAMEYMTANLDRDLHLDQIARQLDLSAFHFARQFRVSTGQTPYQYLMDQRIRRAMQLLRERDWPVSEVAQLTGFGSAVNFTRTFRQRIGVTPQVWRHSA
jgi:AraC family transcriptional regulator